MEYQEHPGIAVLVAENRASARSSLADLLRYEGYCVFEAQDRAEAVACIEANLHLRVLLVDLYLPDCAKIIQRAQLKFPDMFVVGMGVWDAASASCVSTAPHLCLSKPLVFEGVRTAINDYLAASTLDQIQRRH